MCVCMSVCIYVFMVALGLHCCMRAFSCCSEQGLLFMAVNGFLFVAASLVAEHTIEVPGLQQSQHTGSVVVAAWELWRVGSVVVAHWL